MALVIAVVGQKGGCAKSTTARMISREYANAGWTVKIADLDTNQSTSYDWHLRRLQHVITPDIAVERFRTVELALKTAQHYDLLVVDGKPHSSAETLRMVEPATLTILPSGVSFEDLKPQVLLAHELTGKGIPARNLAFVLARTGDSESEISEARAYITQGGYMVLEGSIPERSAYRRANEEGRTVTETRFSSLNEKAAQVAQSIADTAATLQKAQVA